MESPALKKKPQLVPFMKMIFDTLKLCMAVISCIAKAWETTTVIITKEGMHVLGFSDERLNKMIYHRFLTHFKNGEGDLFFLTPYWKSLKLIEEENDKS